MVLRYILQQFCMLRIFPFQLWSMWRVTGHMVFFEKISASNLIYCSLIVPLGFPCLIFSFYSSWFRKPAIPRERSTLSHLRGWRYDSLKKSDSSVLSRSLNRSRAKCCELRSSNHTNSRRGHSHLRQNLSWGRARCSTDSHFSLAQVTSIHTFSRDKSQSGALNSH